MLRYPDSELRNRVRPTSEDMVQNLLTKFPRAPDTQQPDTQQTDHDRHTPDRRFRRLTLLFHGFWSDPFFPSCRTFAFRTCAAEKERRGEETDQIRRHLDEVSGSRSPTGDRSIRNPVSPWPDPGSTLLVAFGSGHNNEPFEVS
jgi:hypothetical protein